MKIYPTKIIKLIATTFVLFLFFSCITDSDLLADIVVEEAIITKTTIDIDNAAITVDEDKAVSFNMLNNAVIKGGRRQYKSSKQPTNGGLVIEKDSIAIYTPEYDYNGTDTIEITLEETNADNTTTEVKLTVEATINPTEDVVDDKVETVDGVAIVIEPLKNDTFNTNSGVIIKETSIASKGTVVINNDNTLTYTPNTGAIGIDLFTYTTEIKNLDDTITTEIGNITVTINSSSSKSWELLVEEGFESGTAAWSSGGTFRSENSDATIVGNAREGNNAVRFTGAAGGARSEFAIRRGAPSKYYEWGVEYWQGIAIKVVRPVGGYGIALQHHAIPEGNIWVNSAGSNSFTLTTSATHLTFWTSTDPNDVLEYPGNTAALGDQVAHRVAYNMNEWIDIVSHFRLAPDNTGFYEIWVNGTKIIDIKNNPTVYKYDSGGGVKYPNDYSKIGVYYGNGSSSGEVHYDSFRLIKGPGSYEAVKPRD